MTNSRAPLLHRYYPASSLLWAPPKPSRLPPISWVLQLYGFPAPPISRRDEEGFSSCFACPCHRAVASHPARVDRRFSQVRPSMLPSPYSCRLGLGGHSLSRPHLRSLSLRPNGSLSSQRMIWSIGFKDSVSFLLAIQATRLLTFASVGLSPTEHASLRWTHNRRCRFPASGSPENSRLRHAQDPKDAAAPDVPSAVATTLLAEVDTAAGCGAPNAGRDGPEHSVQSRSRRSLDNQRKSSSPSLANVDSAPQSERGSA